MEDKLHVFVWPIFRGFLPEHGAEDKNECYVTE